MGRLTRVFSSMEDPVTHTVSGRTLLLRLGDSGLLADDPRIKEVLNRLDDEGGPGAHLDFSSFLNTVLPEVKLVEKALTGKLAVPDFKQFAQNIQEIFEECRSEDRGDVYSDISFLAEADPEEYAACVCTVDGQVFCVGDWDASFSMQACVCPFLYCLALEEHGLRQVHQKVSHEPSGVAFNDLVLRRVDETHQCQVFDDLEDDRLNQDNVDMDAVPVAGSLPSGAAELGFESSEAHRATPTEHKEDAEAIPHNPFNTAGSIVTASMIQVGKPISDTIAYLTQQFSKLASTPMVVDFSTFLAERATADRNYALGYMLREMHAFPRAARMRESLELYTLACAMEANVRVLATMAATLARNGTNPFTNDTCFLPVNVRACLSLLLTCGMNRSSGEWAFHMGIPAKSGVSGGIMAIIPNVCGICVYSPRLDSNFNSARGVKFFDKLVQRFNFHIFDSDTGSAGAGAKLDPTVKVHRVQHEMTVQLLFAASRGDKGEIRSLLANGLDVNVVDYDGRSALHLAAAEGHLSTARFLLLHGANANAADRWQCFPIVDAIVGGHMEVVQLLESRTTNDYRPALRSARAKSASASGTPGLGLGLAPEGQLELMASDTESESERESERGSEKQDATGGGHGGAPGGVSAGAGMAATETHASAPHANPLSTTMLVLPSQAPQSPNSGVPSPDPPPNANDSLLSAGVSPVLPLLDRKDA